MGDPPLLSSISLALPTNLQGVSHITETINQFLLPSTIDGAVYLDLQRVVKVFGATSRWTEWAMNGAAARGRLDIIQWLDFTRSEGCSSTAFADAAGNGHLDVLRWLCTWHRSKCIGTEAMVVAACAGHLEVVKYLRSQDFNVVYSIVVEYAALNEQFQVLEYLLTIDGVSITRALAAAATYGLTEVTQLLLSNYRPVGDMKLDMVLTNSRALEHAAAGGYIDILNMLLEHCRGYYGNQCIGSALLKAAEMGRMNVAVMLEARYEGPAVGKALSAAIVNGHTEMMGFLFEKCPAAEMVPVMEAAANQNLLGLLERILAKYGSNMEFSSRERRTLCLCFRSAASRGNEEIATLLLGTLLSPWGFSIHNAICTVLEEATANFKYGLVKGILNTIKARQLCLPSAFAGSVFKKARGNNNCEVEELLIKFSQEGVVDLGRAMYLEQLKKKQKLC